MSGTVSLRRERPSSSIKHADPKPVGDTVGADEFKTSRPTATQERFAKGVDIIRQGYPVGYVFLVLSGWAMRYRILENGERQIVNFVLPGDVVGIPGMFVEDALYTVSALTEISALRFSQSAMATAISENSKLATQILVLSAKESLTLAEHLTEVGRRSAYDRIGHLFLELSSRSKPATHSDGGLHWLPLTQEIIGDALGLSSVHISRTLTKMRREGVVETRPGAVAVRDPDALARLTGYESAYIAAIAAMEPLAISGDALMSQLSGQDATIAPDSSRSKAVNGHAAHAGRATRFQVMRTIGLPVVMTEGSGLRSSAAKRDVVLRLLAGESAVRVSQCTGISIEDLETWRTKALEGIDKALDGSSEAAEARDLAAVNRRMDELDRRLVALERPVVH
ncbi:MAG TPA: Crp/Fnr family transcriptional regulator [Alphaproteobacteria bacterium]|nr:Crp/Fnr family transcriptional regulator [Alphaproteobacteria bacterium]